MYLLKKTFQNNLVNNTLLLTVQVVKNISNMVTYHTLDLHGRCICNLDSLLTWGVLFDHR